MMMRISQLLVILLLDARPNVAAAARTLQFTPEQACSFGQGTLDPQTSICYVCLNPLSCQCILNPDDFGVTCPPGTFCTDDVVYQNLPDAYCGSAECIVRGMDSTCTAEMDVVDGTLDATFECAAGNVCECRSLNWNGVECGSCSGAMDSYDCGDVGGPVRLPKRSDGADAPVSPNANLDRWYRDDPQDGPSLSEASDQAGVPIGAAIGPTFGGLTDRIPSEYNMIVSENDMKWNNLLNDQMDISSYNFTKADELLKYAVSNNVRVRGHVLIWGRICGTTYPSAIGPCGAQYDEDDNTNNGPTSQPLTEEELLSVMENHIQTVCEHFGTNVDVWDVVNEHLSSLTDDNVFYTTLGHDYVRESFVMARKYCPEGIELTWNEAVSDFGLSNPQIVMWLDMLEEYKRGGVPVDNVGVQGHSINSRHNLNELRIFLDKIAAMGYGVELTEVDAPITLFLSSSEDGNSENDDPFTFQAEYVAGYVSACLDSGSCRGITFWGVDDAHTWLDGVFSATAPNLPLLIDEEGYRKPMWVELRDLLLEFAAGVVGSSEGGQGVVIESNDPAEGEGSEPSTSIANRRRVTWILHLSFILIITYHQ